MSEIKRKFRADGQTLRRLIVQAGLTQEKFCAKTGLDKATSRKLFNGEEVFLSSIVEAGKLFGIQDHLELLHPEELRELGVNPALRELTPYSFRVQNRTLVEAEKTI